MRLLLDSHALIWAVDNPFRLGSQAAEELANPANDLFFERRHDLGDSDQGRFEKAGLVSSFQRVDDPGNRRVGACDIADHR